MILSARTSLTNDLGTTTIRLFYVNGTLKGMVEASIPGYDDIGEIQDTNFATIEEAMASHRTYPQSKVTWEILSEETHAHS